MVQEFTILEPFWLRFGIIASSLGCYGAACDLPAVTLFSSDKAKGPAADSSCMPVLPGFFG